MRYDALVEVPPRFDEIDKAAAALPIEQLPDEHLVYLLASRFCLPDLVADQPWELFGPLRAGKQHTRHDGGGRARHGGGCAATSPR